MRISVLQQAPRFRAGPAGEDFDMAQRRELLRLTMEDCYAMVEEAARQKAELAVTIECVNSFLGYGDRRFHYPDHYEGLDGPQVERFRALAKRHGMFIVAGLNLTIDGTAHNCAVLLSPQGEVAGVHRKVHLPAGEERNITPGDRFQVFETDIGRIGMLVCWDMQYPEAVRELALGGADLIACPTWGWENIYGLSRAYESSVTIAAAMGMYHEAPMEPFCDPSCIVDNMGRIVAAAGRDTVEVVTADVDIAREPAHQYGSEHYSAARSMRENRFLQRKPEAYRLIHLPLEQTPLYRRYRGG